MPSIPYRYLERDLPGLEGMWAALIADLEQRAPCMLFMAYDFFGNGVAPALTDAVGVVSWVQADDGDYHEQAYRLGRYCNAVVCVSEALQAKVEDLNPVIGARTHVIQNSSVSESDVLSKRDRRAETMRIAYTGRLVQYQKRVLDFVPLAEALDKTGVPYTISLIGSFGHDDGVERALKRLAERHLADGRILLPGRMARPKLFAELANHDFFVLLSDFEGFPVAMVEAMARGCVPVVAHSECGIPELVKSGKNGQVVRGRDYDEWASLLVRLWGDRRKLARMSLAARQSVSSRFTVEQAAKKFEQLFIRVGEEISQPDYSRAPSLNWGERSWTGDIIPPPSIYRPGTVQVGGLR